MFDVCFAADCATDPLLQKRLLFDTVITKMAYFLDRYVPDIGRVGFGWVVKVMLELRFIKWTHVHV